MSGNVNTIIVDDQDKSVDYRGTWTNNGSSVNYGQTSYFSSEEGAQMLFMFSGSSVVVVGDIDAGGTCNTTFSIDNITETFNPPLVSTTLHQQTLWSSPQLPDAEHSLVCTIISCASSSNNTSPRKPFLWIDYILYNTSESPADRTFFVDDTNERIKYSGTWDKEGGVGDFRQTRHGGKTGSSLEFLFSGSYVSVNGRIENSSLPTRVSFTLDGDSVTYVIPAQKFVSYNKEFFKNASLPPGQHKLTITPLSDEPFWLDYILVRDPHPAHRESFPMGATIGSILAALGVIIVVCSIIYYRRRTGASRQPPEVPDKRVSDIHHDVIPFPPIVRAPKTPPSVSSGQSTAALLSQPAVPSPTILSSSDNSSQHTLHRPLETDDDYSLPAHELLDCLPPEYSTTASSGDIGHIPSLGNHYRRSQSSSTQFSSRAGTFSNNIHRRHNSGSVDLTEDAESYYQHSLSTVETRSVNTRSSPRHPGPVPHRPLPPTPPTSPLRSHIAHDNGLLSQKLKGKEKDRLYEYTGTPATSQSRNAGYAIPLSPLNPSSGASTSGRFMGTSSTIHSPQSSSAVLPIDRHGPSPGSPASHERDALSQHSRLRAINPDGDESLSVPRLNEKQLPLPEPSGIAPIVHVDSGIRLMNSPSVESFRSPDIYKSLPNPPSRPGTANTHISSRPDTPSAYSRPGTASTFNPSRPNTATSAAQNSYGAANASSPNIHLPTIPSASTHHPEESDALELPPLYTPN